MKIKQIVNQYRRNAGAKDMSTEQLRADFEAWYASRHETYDTTFIYYTPENRYQHPSVDKSWSAYQAGRAALLTERDALAVEVQEQARGKAGGVAGSN